MQNNWLEDWFSPITTDWIVEWIKNISSELVNHWFFKELKKDPFYIDKTDPNWEQSFKDWIREWINDNP